MKRTKRMNMKNLMRTISIGLGILIALGGAVSAQTGIPTYTIVDLGTFGSPGSETWSSGYALNEHGDVSGVAEDDYYLPKPFLYRDGEMIDLGALTPGYWVGWARALNDHGEVAGSSMGWSPYPKFPTWVERPFVWTPEGGMAEQLVGVGLDGEITGINDRGQLAVSLTTVPDVTPVTEAHFWDPETGLHAIPFPGTLGIPVRSAAWAINQNGQVAGSFTFGDDVNRAYTYDPETGETTDLHNDFALQSAAFGINDRGDVSGWLQDAAGQYYSTVWTPDGRIVRIRANLDPALISGLAADVNNLGDVVGTDSTVQGVSPLAWVAFDAVDGPFFPSGYPETIRLVDLLSETDSSEWDLLHAYGINDARQIVGIGVHNGQYRAYLMTPDATP